MSPEVQNKATAWLSSEAASSRREKYYLLAEPKAWRQANQLLYPASYEDLDSQMREAPVTSSPGMAPAPNPGHMWYLSWKRCTTTTTRMHTEDGALSSWKIINGTAALNPWDKEKHSAQTKLEMD